MSYSIKTSKQFEKDLKRLVKKYSSLKSEYIELLAKLSENPLQGMSLGKNLYKVRLAISSKKKGKSGGARVITYVHFLDEEVLLLSIYDKGEKSNISDEEIQELINKYT